MASRPYWAPGLDAVSFNPPNSLTDGSTTLPPFSRGKIEFQEVKQLVQDLGATG